MNDIKKEMLLNLLENGLSSSEKIKNGDGEFRYPEALGSLIYTVEQAIKSLKK